MTPNISQQAQLLKNKDGNPLEEEKNLSKIKGDTIKSNLKVNTNPETSKDLRFNYLYDSDIINKTKY